MSTRRLLVVLVLAFGLMGGCKAKGDKGGCGLTLDPFGGYARIEMTPPNTIDVTALLVERNEPDDDEITIPEKGSGCGLTSTNPFAGFVLTPMSAATALTFASGARVLTAIRDTSGHYAATFSAFGPLDADWTVTLSASATVAGGELGTVRVPDAVNNPTQTPMIPGEEWEVSFTDTDSDHVIVELTSADGLEQWTCWAKADGDYTIPGEVTAEVGSGATLSFIAEDRNVVHFEGREVLLVGANRSN